MYNSSAKLFVPLVSSKVVLLLWIFFAFAILCHVCFLESCGHLLLLAHLYVMFACVLSPSHMVNWVRCGI